MRKTALTALSAALLIGVLGSVAIASDRDDSYSGGYKIGPLGQVLGGDEWGTRGQNAYGFVPAPQTRHPATHKHAK